MREVQEQLQRLARGEQPVWINGELGSGRQSAALTLHQQSGLRSGPCRVCHRAELAPIAALVLAESSAAQQEGLSRLQALLTRTRGGTLILDEGGTPDPAFQVLVLELLRLRQSPATRLVLLTCANQEGAGEAEPPLLPALLSSLSGRLLRVPALRVRREEIADLALELWRTAPRQRSAEAPPPQMTPAVEAPLSVAVSADAAGEEAAPEISAPSAASAVSDAAPAPPEAPVGAAPVDEAPTLEEDTLELLRERLLLVEELDLNAPREGSEPTVSPEDLCFLQYTSGSTRTPAGVMVTHAGLMENMRQIQSDWFEDFGGLAPEGRDHHPLFTAQGLFPRRYDEDTKLLFRERRRVTMLFEPEAIVMPDGQRLRRWAGVQDTASQFVQLSWLFSTRPELLRTGNTVDFALALPKNVDRWVYDVLGEEPVATHFGAVDAFHLKPRRVSRPGGDLVAEIWFAPTLRYLPARIRIEQDADTFIDLVLSRKPELAQQ